MATTAVLPPLLPSQLSAVIGAYETVIRELPGTRRGREKELAAQAMHELGNIMYHVKNTKYVSCYLCGITYLCQQLSIPIHLLYLLRSAGLWWCEALQSILHPLKDPLNNWRELLPLSSADDAKNDGKQTSFKSFGLQACLLGGILASKLAK